MAPDTIASITEATTTVVFVVFVLYLQKSQQSSVKLNHEEWRSWLADQNKAWRESVADIVKMANIESARRHDEATAERSQLTEAIRHLDNHVERLTTINLIVYATIKGDEAEAKRLEQELMQ